MQGFLQNRNVSQSLTAAHIFSCLYVLPIFLSCLFTIYFQKCHCPSLNLIVGSSNVVFQLLIYSSYLPQLQNSHQFNLSRNRQSYQDFHCFRRRKVHLTHMVGCGQRLTLMTTINTKCKHTIRLTLLPQTCTLYCTNHCLGCHIILSCFKTAQQPWE